MTDRIYSVPTDGGEMLVTPITKGTKVEAAFAGIEAARRNRAHYKICSMCRRLVPIDPRGDVLDGSGRCTECQP